MKRHSLLVLAAGMLMLASCGNNPASSPAASSPAPADTSSQAPATLSSIRVDASKAKKVYLVTPAMPDRVDEIDTTGIKLTGVYSDGSEKDIRVSSDVTFSADLSSAGEKDVTVTYGSLTTSYKVKVGTYSATAASIANVDGKAIVTVSGTFSGVTADELKAFPFTADFQENGYNGGAWNGGWAEKANGAVTLTTGEGTFSYTRDVTELDDYLYTGHFGHKQVANDNNGFQNMDLKIQATEEKSQSITIGDRTYTIDYNLGSSDPAKCWGNLSLKIATAGTPAWAVSGITIANVENKAMLTVSVAFENYTEAEFRALEWRLDFQNDNEYAGGGWDYPYKKTDLTLGAAWTIADGVASYSVDVTEFAPNGYTLHFGVGGSENQAPDYKPQTFTNSDKITVGSKKYQVVCFPGSSAGNEFWGCVGLVVEGVAHNEAITSASIGGSDSVVLSLGGTGEALADDLFKVDVQATTGDWATTVLTSSANVNEGAWTVQATVPATLDNGNYLVHWFVDGKSHDLEKKSDVLADFAASSKVLGDKKFDLRVENMWDRDMIVIAVSTVA